MAADAPEAHLHISNVTFQTTITSLNRLQLSHLKASQQLKASFSEFVPPVRVDESGDFNLFADFLPVPAHQHDEITNRI